MDFYRKHRKVILVSALAFCFVVLAGSLCWWRLSHNTADFQAYEPTVLPSDTHITARTLELWYGEISHPEFLINLSKADITIAEEHVTTNQEARGTCTGGSNETCQQYKTPQQQAYFVDTVTYSNSTSKTISFTKDDTFIWISLNGHDAAAVDSVTDWNKVIDSFHPVSLTGVRTELVHAGP
jgi:hypothetical protein